MPSRELDFSMNWNSIFIFKQGKLSLISVFISVASDFTLVMLHLVPSAFKIFAKYYRIKDVYAKPLGSKKFTIIYLTPSSVLLTRSCSFDGHALKQTPGKG